MIALPNIQATLDLNAQDADFLTTHMMFEAYERRLFYLALRFERFTHYGAQHIESYQFIRSDGLYRAIFHMLSNGAKKYSDVKQTYKDFAILVDLHEQYATHYRNRIVHGVISPIIGDFSKLLCHINISLMREFERVLNAILISP